MTLPELKEHIARKQSELEKAGKYAENRLASMPRGSLYIRKEKGSLRYYNHDAAEGTYRYLDSRSTAEIRLLEEKNYLGKLIRTFNEEKSKLEKVRSILDKTEAWETVFFGIREEKRHLIEPVEFVERRTGKKEMDAWNAIPKRKNSFETPQQDDEHRIRGKPDKTVSHLTAGAFAPAITSTITSSNSIRNPVW